MDINTREIIIALIGVFVGASVSIPITITRVQKAQKSTTVKQGNIFTNGGDVVGRDKKV